LIGLTFLVVGYGAQILVLQKTVEVLEKEGISAELIDLSMYQKLQVRWTCTD
jgi:pyruvate/2-oxoglutarate/acetoin dehydrogenase E1 component